MSSNYETKKIILNINKFQDNEKKYKIYLISIGKINLLNYNNNEEKNYFKLIYERKLDFQKNIKLFGKNFIQNNNKLRIITNNKDMKIKEYLITNGKIKIKKEVINRIINMSHLFSNCKSFNSLPDISNWNTNKVTNMSFIFFNCKLLHSLPDISKWNTNKVRDISYMFYNCSSLNLLPDISKWNTNNITNMSHLFDNCT